MYHINSDNSKSSQIKCKKSSDEIIQVKDRDNVNKKNRKPIKKEESRKTLKNNSSLRFEKLQKKII